MKRFHSLLVAGFAMLLLAVPPAYAQQRVVIATDIGEIEVEVDSNHAPITSANFLKYVDEGFYTDGVFHRTVTPENQPDNKVKIEVIQGGVNPEPGKQDYPAIPLERTSDTGLKHLDGVISMARDTPDTATSDFFICVGDQPELDFAGKRNPDGQGFAAFGRVVRGMDVVRKIQKAPAEGQKLTPPVRILNMERVKTAPASAESSDKNKADGVKKND
jgi:peptidyl-prolyl cis-trans isomerase A (cyclophilin A)